jgi:replicative DNA helicase
MLQDGNAAELAIRELRPTDFFDDRHRAIFSAFASLSTGGTYPDELVLIRALVQQGKDAAAGGSAYVYGLRDLVPSAGNIAKHVEILRIEGRQRLIISQGKRLVERVTKNGDDPEDHLRDFYEIVGTANARGSARPAEGLPALDQPVAVLRKLRDQGDPVPTGIPALDEQTRGGMRPGKALIAGGTAGSGKTSVGIQIAKAAAEAGCVVVCLMADEGREPAIIRLGQQFGYERDALEGVDHPAHETALAALERDLAGLDILFPDPDGEADHTLEGTVEALVAAYPDRRKLVVVDSIQTVRTRQTMKDSPSIRERVMGAARIARHLAVEHGLVMVYTSEVNRSWYRAKREEDRASDLAAFAEARIEFSGDVLVTLRSLDEDPDLVEVRIPKNRLGTRKGFLMRLNRERARFDEVDGDYATAARSAAETARLDEARETILRELRDNPGVTRRQLQDLVGIKVGIFSEALKRVKCDGMVRTAPKGTAIQHYLTEVPK